MDDLTHTRTNDGMLKNDVQVSEDLVHAESSNSRDEDAEYGGDGTADERDGDEDAREIQPRGRRFILGRNKDTYSHTHYRVYKRRWLGLMQLVLLNIVVSWDWLTFAPISTSSAEYFRVSESWINWLATAFLFSFAVTTPLTIYLLHRGPKDSIIAASILLFVGNWIRFAGTKANGGIYGVVMFGQILTGLAQPFVLAAPTRYSDMWFTERGRTGATALASLANPLGGAIASLVNPNIGSVPTTVLIIACVASVACIPSFFIPARPKSPPSASANVPKTPVMQSLKFMLRSGNFYLVFLTFSTYVGFFNAFSSLLNQILYPYGYSEEEAGIAGGLMLGVGIVVAIVTIPIVDRTHAYLLGIKILCPVLAITYLAMIWAPETRTIIAPYVLSAVLGASSFPLLPIALEYLVEITFPASPEVSSTICWVGGQIFGGFFIVAMNALKDTRPVDLEKVRKGGRTNGGGNRPPGHMFNALVFQAVFSLAMLSLPLILGVKRFNLATSEGRLRKDEDGDSVITSFEGVEEGTGGEGNRFAGGTEA